MNALDRLVERVKALQATPDQLISMDLIMADGSPVSLMVAAGPEAVDRLKQLTRDMLEIGKLARDPRMGGA